MPIESKTVSRAIQSAQTQVEQQNFEIRKDVLKYDDVLNKQRTVIYGERRTVLEGADLPEPDPPDDRRGGRGYVEGATAMAIPRSGTSTSCGPRSVTSTRSSLTVDGRSRRPAATGQGSPGEFIHRDRSRPTPRPPTTRREEELGAEVMRELERRVVLSVLDRKWREHLYEMDYLREGIGLRAMAQRDPLVEYQREGFDMFAAMMEGIKEESVGYLFNSRVEIPENPIVEESTDGTAAAPQVIGQILVGTHDGVPGDGGAQDSGVQDSGVQDSDAQDGAQADGVADGAGTGRSNGGRGSGGRGGRGGRHAAGRGRSGAGATPAAQPSAAAGAPAVVAPGLGPPQRPERLSYTAPGVNGAAQVERRTDSAAEGEFGKVGRNAPCPCGSGRKYKLCHGDPRNRG